MKKTFSILIIALAALSVSAEGKLDVGSRARLRAATSGLTMSRSGRGSVKAPVRKAASATTVVRGFLTLAPGHDAAELEAIGVKVTSARGTSLLVEFDAALVAQLEAMDAVSKIVLESPLAPKMDRVRSVTHIDEIHSGSANLPQAYTGKGIIAGIVDGGFDPNHLNFLNDKGVSRISNFCYYRPTQSGDYYEQIVGPDVIWDIDTESSETFHGTHTLGIMAGGYKGKVNAPDRLGSKEIDNPYYGIAYDADIALASGANTDYYVAMGMETILNYAYYNKKRTVINLSLGNNTGPHDGTSALCGYIDGIVANDNAIVCISAGNEGNLPIAITKTFTATDKIISSCFTMLQEMSAEDAAAYPNIRAGATYVYSKDATQFDIQAIVVNKDRGAVAMRMPLPATTGASKYWATSAAYAQDGDIISPQLAKWFNGYVGVGAQFDEVTGRYYAVIDAMLWDNATGNANGNYVLGFEITGHEGQRVDVYGDAQFNGFSSLGIEGFMDGQGNGTINDIATGKGTISVGSYNTRDRWTSLDGEVWGYDEGVLPAGEVSMFSSYGTLIDGRNCPAVCAPGAAVISSSNEYYLQDNGLTSPSVSQADFTANGRHYSWHQALGTSMAAPVVSGTVCLWLEADPTLTVFDVLDIIEKTAVKDDDVAKAADPVQWGAGKFDALAGLKEVLARKQSGICSPAAPGSDCRVLLTAQGEGMYEVSLPGAPAINADLYNLSGIMVASAKAEGSDAVLDASGVLPGIYVLSVNGTHSLKFTVK